MSSFIFTSETKQGKRRNQVLIVAYFWNVVSLALSMMMKIYRRPTSAVAWKSEATNPEVQQWLRLCDLLIEYISKRRHHRLTSYNSGYFALALDFVNSTLDNKLQISFSNLWFYVEVGRDWKLFPLLLRSHCDSASTQINFENVFHFPFWFLFFIPEFDLFASRHSDPKDRSTRNAMQLKTD